MPEFAVPALAEIPDSGGIADLIYTNAEQSPSDVVFRRKSAGGWQDVTAEQFLGEVVDVAKGLIAAGVQAGDRVAILAATRYEWTLLDFAIWAAGGIGVPIYVTSSQEQIQWILADSGAVAVVTETPEHEAKVAAVRGELPALKQVWQLNAGAIDTLVAAGKDVAASTVDARRAAVRPDDVATIIYTSGTTGRPKGCVLTHANFFAEAGNAVELLHPLFKGADIEDTRTLLFLPLAHVFGRMVEVGCVRARAIMGHAPDVKNLLDDLATFQPTFILSVPYVLEKVYNGARQKAHAGGKGKIFDAAAATAIEFSETASPGLLLKVKHAVFDKLVYRKLRDAIGGHCRYAISGGAALGHRLTHFYRGIGLTVFEGYGLTETTAAATVNSPVNIKPGTVGQPLPGTAVKISPDGEILVKGGQVFRGYWNNDEATAQTFVDGWFATGDIGELDADGYLRITGRKKEILVTRGGKNVAPAVIEDRISAHPLVGQAMVVGDGQKYVAALITIDAEYFTYWKTTAGKDAGATVADLADDPDLNAEIQKAVDDGNSAVSHAESVRRFRILSVEFTPENGRLTPSLKLKRNVIMNEFASDVDALYS